MVVVPGSAVVEYSLFTRTGGFLSHRLVHVDTASRPGQSLALLGTNVTLSYIGVSWRKTYHFSRRFST